MRAKRMYECALRACTNALKACQYAEDKTLFDKADFWQHPVDFEQKRQGDCEDFSLWAWRKLCEMGINAEFVTGEERKGGGHAWVTFELDGQEFLLEAADTPVEQ